MASTQFIEKNRDIILEREKTFCHQVSAAVIEKPRLGVWMILIPVFFVFYFWQLSRYSEGRKDFAKNFLVSRERALNCAFEAAKSNSAPNIELLLDAIELPDQARQKYKDWILLLTSHFLKLINGKGETFTELVHSSYGSKKDLRNFYEQLSQAEREFNSSIAPDQDAPDTETLDVLQIIDAAVTQLRHQEIKDVFSTGK